MSLRNFCQSTEMWSDFDTTEILPKPHKLHDHFFILYFFSLRFSHCFGLLKVLCILHCVVGVNDWGGGGGGHFFATVYLVDQQFSKEQCVFFFFKAPQSTAK